MAIRAQNIQAKTFHSTEQQKVFDIRFELLSQLEISGVKGYISSCGQN